MTEPHSEPPTPRARELTIRLDDLLEDLLWPTLLRAVPLALRPERIGLALFALVVVWLIGALPTAWSDNPNLAQFLFDRFGGALAALWGSIVATVLGEPTSLGTAAGRLVADVPIELVRTYPVSGVVLFVAMLLVVAVAGGAIARMAACDLAQGVLLTWPEALGFALSRFGALATAVLGPILVVGVLMLALAVGGWILFSWPVLGLVGAALYVLFLLGALLVVVLVALYLLGWPMLLPAVACEGTDGIDAIQRAFAYVIGRPLRLVLYAAILILTGLVAWTVVRIAGEATVAVSAWLASAWLGESAATPLLDPSAPADGARAAIATMVRFWSAVVMLIVAAFALSYACCASTCLYLLLRRVNDGQEISELWMPGQIEATMAEAMHARAQSGQPEPPAGPDRPDDVS